MPSVYELELSYPHEVKAERHFVAAIRRRFRVKLPKSEVQGIVMHLINARERSKTDEAQGMEQFNEEILDETTRIIEEELHIKVQKGTFNYARFATHVQYLVDRIFEHRPIDTDNLLLYRSVQEEYTEVSDCVRTIKKPGNLNYQRRKNCISSCMSTVCVAGKKIMISHKRIVTP